MTNRRKAWLVNGNGKRPNRKGFWVRWHEYGARGERLRTPCKKFDSYVHARRYVKEYNARNDLRRLGDIIPITLGDAIAEFLRGCSQLSESTFEHYSITLRFAHEFFGLNIFLTEIDTPMVDEYIYHLGQSRRPATVKKYLSSVDRVFNWAMKRGYAGMNPVTDATSRPKGTYAKEKYIPTDEELGRFVDAIPRIEQKVAVIIGFTTGFDRRVISNLHSYQIDLVDKVFRITRPKTRKVLVVPIHESVLSFLDHRVRNTVEGQRLLYGLSRRSRENDWFRRAARSVGLPDRFVFQTLRAVATTRLIRAGEPAGEVQKLLGHSSINTTMRHYFQADPAAAERLRKLSIPKFQALQVPKLG